MLKDIERRIRSLEARLNQSVQVGEVTSVDAARGTAQVRLATPGNADGLITHDLPVLVRKTHADKDYAMPDVGEQVLCVFLPMGLETGFVLGSFYSSRDTPPVASADKWHVTFSDGTSLEYDRAVSTLSVDVSGSQNLNTTGDKTESVGGKLNITVTGEALVSAAKITLAGGDGALLDGVVTAQCVCNVLGILHQDKSAVVLASKA
ncbi:phage baseplate assembly protein V [Desulfocurvibacter africanus]|uniref:Phage baseplate assembly protein V n=1 Tax=Desulfocurvibacter africanus subsp. africanus str. Walvis Bay TaxID=690850 RepID=F3YY65_DESAF|nr:phage baseplate assembly protein V [Desulfocurvibacter africanus]EGJ51841.1 phage baseplate assembly protein V [Desulfocurvibacter africanus subsp. africanus str. Walvis Bay]